MIRIRPANKQDAAECSRILCASIKQLCIKDHQGDPKIVSRWLSNKDSGSLSRWISDAQSTMYVAECGGVACGVGAISRDGEVMLNYVCPKYQFQGVSKAMLSELETSLRADGVKSARLNSTVTAHRFYKGLGWVDSGEPETWLGMKNHPMTKLL